MLNVQALTQTLSAMPLNQLQQYAQLHRNDPYVVTMALSIANQKKQAMIAQQGQAGMQPQPKVVDSEIAQMVPQQMPEDQGIGQLPAGNMDFADGGIIAFADGGDVERFNGSQSQFVRDLINLPQQYTEYQQRIRESDRIKAEREREMAQRRQDELAARQKTSFANYLFGSPEREAEGKAELAQLATTPIRAPAAAPKAAPTFSPEESRAMLNRAEQPARVNPAVYGAPVPAAPPVDTTPRVIPGAGAANAVLGAAAAGPKQPTQAGLGDLSAMYADILKKQDFKDPAEDKLKSLEAKELAAAEEAKAALLRDQAKFDDAYKGREKRLSDRETDIGKQKDINTGLAFLNAGLAIMSTPGGLAAAVGKGARVGTEQFAAGLDKIRSAQERLDDARDKMEDLKLNRAEMSAKEIRAAEKDIRSVGVDAEKRGIEGLRMAADVNRRTAAEMFKATVDVGVNREKIAAERDNTLIRERGENARSTERLKATINDPTRMAFMAELEKTKTKENPQGDPAAAYQRIVAMKREPVSTEKLRGDWLDMAKRMQIQADYPNIKTFEDYVTVFGGGVGGAGAGSDGLRVVGVR
jgi:hypothetical protein